MNGWQLLSAIICIGLVVWIVAMWATEQMNKKLDRIIALLDKSNQQRGEGNSSLRGTLHYTKNISANTATHDPWEED